MSLENFTLHNCSALCSIVAVLHCDCTLSVIAAHITHKYFSLVRQLHISSHTITTLFRASHLIKLQTTSPYPREEVVRNAFIENNEAGRD
jgi:hypothetical protein